MSGGGYVHPQNPAVLMDINHRINESAVTPQAESSVSRQVSVSDTVQITRMKQHMSVWPKTCI